tara:strand:+ start:492 stop:1094 length:603 start_codon:yes stop_codon:yes gene_type:complete
MTSLKYTNWPLPQEAIENHIERAEMEIKEDYPEFKVSNYDEIYFDGDTLNPNILFYTPFTYSTDSNYYGACYVSFYKNKDVQSIGSEGAPFRYHTDVTLEPVKEEDKKALKKVLKKLRKLSEKKDNLELKHLLNASGGSTSLHILKVENGHKLYYRSDNEGHFESLTMIVNNNDEIFIEDEYNETPETEYPWTYKLVSKK